MRVRVALAPGDAPQRTKVAVVELQQVQLHGADQQQQQQQQQQLRRKELGPRAVVLQLAANKQIVGAKASKKKVKATDLRLFDASTGLELTSDDEVLTAVFSAPGTSFTDIDESNTGEEELLLLHVVVTLEKQVWKASEADLLRVQALKSGTGRLGVHTVVGEVTGNDDGINRGNKVAAESAEESSGSAACTTLTAAAVDQAQVRILAHESRVEAESIKQLQSTSALPGMRFCVGMPDLHPGKGFPIGAAMASDGVVYPSLVGNDIGCGMLFLQLDARGKFQASRATGKRLERWAASLGGLESPWSGDGSNADNDVAPSPSTAWLERAGVTPTSFDASHLGTIGGGNHFAELQKIETLVDPDYFRETLKLDPDALFLMVHSGSRALGADVLRHHVDTYGPRTGLRAGSSECDDYLRKHDHAIRWATCNRQVIAHRFLQCLGLASPFDSFSDKASLTVGDAFESRSGQTVLDVCHNGVVQREFTTGGADPSPRTLWLHRKGAAPAEPNELVVIPGSRGAHSYLVLPVVDEGVSESSTANLERAAFSVAHGAGRKWNRGKAQQMDASRGFKQQHSFGDGGDSASSASLMRITKLGSHVICDDKELLMEEQPDAYKDIEAIIADLVHEGLIRVIAVMTPLITYKMRAIRRDK